MTNTIIMLGGGLAIGFLLGIAIMLLLRNRPGENRVWSPEDPEHLPLRGNEPEATGRTQSEDTSNRAEHSSGRTGRPNTATIRRRTPVAMLTAKDGSLEGKSWILRYADSTTIGRFDDCDIAIDDNDVSRLHAQITHRTDAATAHEFSIFDYSSTNGTMVNGQPINAVASLQDGDQLKIGNTEFTFQRIQQE